MRLSIAIAFAVTCLAQSDVWKLPPYKTSLTIESQPVAVAIWADVTPTHLLATIDLADFQEHLTPILAAQLNRTDRCGEHLNVEHAALSSSGLLTVNAHYERYGCAKALGKEIVKRLVGGNAVVEVMLTPSVAENHIAMNAEVRKIDADGSLGEMLRSGSFGDSLRQKIASSIESSVRKSADLHSALPAGVEQFGTLRTIRFADGGNGGLWLTVDADLHLSPEQFQLLSRHN